MTLSLKKGVISLEEQQTAIHTLKDQWAEGLLMEELIKLETMKVEIEEEE